MERKSVASLELKGDEGQFRAVFSTLNVLDAHEDVTVPGAFDVGADVIIGAYGHASWGGLFSAAVLPAGKGVLGANDQEAWAEGEFFLDTEVGRETYATAKRLGGLMQWSYGFDPLKYDFGEFEGENDVRFLRKLLVHEVSPVLVGAGVNTRTEWVKSLSGISLLDHEHAALAATESLVERWKALAAALRNEGREFSKDRKARIADDATGLRALAHEASAIADELEALLSEAPADADTATVLAIARAIASRGIHISGGN